MKKTYLLLFALLPLLNVAQVIRYDTIRVLPNDERNIHRNKTEYEAHQQAPYRKREQEPVLLQQEKISGFDKSKLRIGANVGLFFSKNYSTFALGPQIGYQFTDYFMGGAGVKYYYTKTRAYLYEEKYLYKNNLLGFNTFAYIYPTSFIALFVQPEVNYLWSSVTNEITGRKTSSQGWVPSVVIGGGLRLGRSHITLNYDLVQHTNSPYPRNVFLGISLFF